MDTLSTHCLEGRRLSPRAVLLLRCPHLPIGPYNRTRRGFDPRTFRSTELHFDYSATAPSQKGPPAFGPPLVPVLLLLWLCRCVLLVASPVAVCGRCRYRLPRVAATPGHGRPMPTVPRLADRPTLLPLLLPPAPPPPPPTSPPPGAGAPVQGPVSLSGPPAAVAPASRGQVRLGPRRRAQVPQVPQVSQVRSPLSLSLASPRPPPHRPLPPPPHRPKGGPRTRRG